MTIDPKNRVANPKCYAAQLGGCSAQISNEHYISDAILRLVSEDKRSVLVRNLTFQRRNILEPKGISSLVAKVLCVNHNSELSRFDIAGLEMFDAMDQIDSAAGEYGSSPIPIHVNGDDFERWMLKALCGGLFSGNLPVAGKSHKAVNPPMEWIKILCVSARFPTGCGLYVRAGTPGVVFETEPSVFRVAAEFDADNRVVGFKVLIFNFEFLLLLAPVQADRMATLQHCVYRPSALNFQGADGSHRKIQFQWRDGSTDELQVVCLGNPTP